MLSAPCASLLGDNCLRDRFATDSSSLNVCKGDAAMSVSLSVTWYKRQNGLSGSHETQ